VTGDTTVAAGDAGDLLLSSAELLFVNGQTTERVVDVLERLAMALGLRADVFPAWGELSLRTEGPVGSQQLITPAKPAGIHMGKVAATMTAIDLLCAGQLDAATLRVRLAEIAKYPPASLVRFALLAGAGAAALGVIFGTSHLVSLVLIAFSGGAGAVLRRWLAELSSNLFVQPLCAALLAGVIGAIAVRLQLSSESSLIAVCPCMVLVPGPHLLNGMLDLTRGRIPLGASRIFYACTIILMICAGLLAGLALGGVTLPVAGPSRPDELGDDVISAGVAVAAYGTFFSMPWRTLPIPILMGMFAHACRWVMISMAGASLEAGAFAGCLIVGVCATSISARLRLPFAAFGFASVVSLIPGVYLFRMAGGLVGLLRLGTNAPLNLLLGTITDGMTAFLTLLAMACGLIVPKLCMECVWSKTISADHCDAPRPLNGTDSDTK
jgi:uncharacterized membrane protein YjjP (DUF1212 family)